MRSSRLVAIVAAATLSPITGVQAVAGHLESHNVNRRFVTIDLTYPFDEFLWEKYGLNTSAEYKYFHEEWSNEHYDARFFKGEIDEDQKAESLRQMIRSYLIWFEKQGLETWIAHGTLIGWYWNRKILPWDADIDTQVSNSTLQHLADNYNQTTVSYRSPDTGIEYEYLLDVNPWARERSRGMGINLIDARWIDTKTSLYIDITGLSALDPSKPNVWEDKNYHVHMSHQLWPLHRTMFEGAPALVPFDTEKILIEEYTESAISAIHYEDHTWSEDKQEWVMGN